jgi:MFS family permease
MGLEEGTPSTTIVTSTANAVYYLGAFVGCMATAAYGDWIGRKKTIWISLAFLIIGSALQTGSQFFACGLSWNDKINIQQFE